MKGFESAFACLGDIADQQKIKADFKEAIKEIRAFFPECDIYVADGINPPRVSVGIKRSLEQKRASACIFRFSENIDEIKIYLNFNLGIKRKGREIRIKKFNKALIDVGGLEAFKRIENGKQRYGVSIDNLKKLKKILKLISQSDLNDKMNGNSRNPDDYEKLLASDSAKNPKPSKKFTTRAAVEATNVDLNENGFLKEKFCAWLGKKNIYKKINPEDGIDSGQRVDVSMFNSQSQKRVLCELKWINDLDYRLKIRMAVGQLLEYEFYDESKDSELWLVINQLPAKRYIAYLNSLKVRMNNNFHVYVLKKDDKNFECLTK